MKRYAVWLAGCVAFVCLSCCALAQTPAPKVAAATFTNPLLWEDLADDDVFRVGDAYFLSASNMHYSPGAPILRSYDLVNWEYVGHSVPVLDFGPAYDLQGGSAYVKGTWASFLNYRKSDRHFYWGGCVEFKKTYLYTAPAAEGPWQRKAVLDKCYYDAGLLIDDDDTMYVAYGNTNLSVAQLSADGTREVRSEKVFTAPADVKVLEGSRFYKRNGSYYIFTTRPANGQYVLRSTTGPFGPYTLHKVLLDTVSPIVGAGVPHQGGLVQTPKGDWYYLAFTDAFPGGRVPVLAPVHWSADGWPEVELKDNTWAKSYPYPAVPHPLKPLTGTDLFQGKALGPEWEWNHNPDNTHWALQDGLTLQTATVTDDLYLARNTLTHRILGPQSTATIELNVAGMKDGDRAGLAMLRDSSAWVGVTRDAGVLRVVEQDGLTMGPKWVTTSTGKEAASVALPRQTVWLRVTADIRPGAGRTASFSYSLDGQTYETLGTPFVMNEQWMFFMGYRYAIFNYATRALGGEVKVRSFTMTAP